MGNTGKGLGIVALIIAIGALGLGLYPIILPSPSEGPKIYTALRYDRFDLDVSTLTIISDLNVTYNTKAGDSVLLEFSCQIYIDITGGSTTIDFSFDIDGGVPSPYTELSVTGLSPDSYLRTSGIMRHNIQSSTAGTHVIRIQTYIDADSNSYVRYCILTATVY